MSSSPSQPGLTASVKTPMSKNDPTSVKVEEIPLPPPELWNELDNSGDGMAPAPEPEPAKSEAPAPAPVAVLEFEGDSHKRVVPLKHPFRHNGQRIAEVTVRRMTIGEVDHFIRQSRDQSFTTFDVYAFQTGLPAEVLRGLIDEDGDAVTDAAFDFLPRAIREAFGLPAN